MQVERTGPTEMTCLHRMDVGFPVSGGRVSNTWATCPKAGDNIWKQMLIPHKLENHMVFPSKMVSAITLGWARGALASW